MNLNQAKIKKALADFRQGKPMPTPSLTPEQQRLIDNFKITSAEINAAFARARAELEL